MMNRWTSAIESASSCGSQGTARSYFVVTFAPWGHATRVLIEGDSPLMGTNASNCVAAALLATKVPLFYGGPARVRFSAVTPR